ncbi:MAG TPA: hypothetical protein VJZ75_01010 [Candidatus Bathyarchaeia archaeon]|nr:hypothetical protein [Candidatus Bathyarchaeia archaeon]
MRAEVGFLAASLTSTGSPSNLIDLGEALQTLRDEYGEHVSKRSKTF